MRSFTQNKTTLVDTSVLVAYFRKEEKDHENSQAFLESLDRFSITDYILLEFMTVLQIREGRSAMKTAMEFLKGNKDVDILRLTQVELSETIHFMQNCSKEISFADASSLVIAKSRDFKVATLDKEMVKAGEEL